ncbi:MAG: phosphatidylcholine/phosphatidylserine synthase [Calditrichaeota bacterium]|nr:phosphatidylcholine/phosphatidylserine synthase [Calditrichota bacterium]MCB9366434.1 phosphatidylcholine/phosphatidylserine synthase [Calditrichota bacterium]
MRNLANILTGMNLVCGFAAILLAMDGHMVLSAWLIMLAVTLDAFDGKAARFFGVSSPLGLQFDSMADVVSMGVAPSVLCYAAAFQDESILGMVVCTIPVLAAAFRLARFNVLTSRVSGLYEGLTSPLHAGLVATFVIMNIHLWGEIASAEVLAGLLIATSLLMVGRLPIGGLPRFTFREHGRNMIRLVALALFILAAMFDPPLLSFPIMLLLVLSAIVAGQLQARRKSEEDDDLPEPLTSIGKNS